MAKSANKPFFSRSVLTFLGCVMLSAGIWILHQLSKEYTLFIKIPVTYLNVADKDLLAADLPDSLDAEVKGSGFTIFASKWTNVMNPLELDLNKARVIGNGNFALATNTHTERLAGTLGHGYRLINVMPDTIIVSFSGRLQKTVPVRPNVNVTCAPMFRIADSIATDPAFITLSGADVLLDQITYVETEARAYKDLDHAVNDKIKLILPKELSQVKMNSDEVELRIAIGKYTEGKVVVPIEQRNVPADILLKTFPDKVEIFFLVPVEDLNSITPEMFQAIIDYSTITAKSESVNVQITKQPLNVRDVRAVPSKVEFIIRR